MWNAIFCPKLFYMFLSLFYSVDNNQYSGLCLELRSFSAIDVKWHIFCRKLTHLARMELQRIEYLRLYCIRVHVLKTPNIIIVSLYHPIHMTPNIIIRSLHHTIPSTWFNIILSTRAPTNYEQVQGTALCSQGKPCWIQYNRLCPSHTHQYCTALLGTHRPQANLLGQHCIPWW